MKTISLTVNGRKFDSLVEPRTHLGDFLREQLRLTGTHLACEHGICGACTVLIDGIPARSCLAYAVACDGQEVRTIEGFEDDSLMEELRQAFKREHGLQCGFCTAGILIASRDIVMRLPDADEQRVRHELSGNLCRCTGYIGIINAVRSVIESRRAKGAHAEAPMRRVVIEKGRESSVAVSQARSTVAKPAEKAPSPPIGTGGAARAGWTKFADSFVINYTPKEAWAVLSDFPLVVSCIPGAELIEYGDRHVKGRLTVKIGPMRAAFSGSAEVDLDAAALKGRIRGAGSDSGSASRTKADATFVLEPDASGGSRVSLAVEYNLQGSLAQFSRSGVAQDVGRRLINQFSANLNARLTKGDIAAAAPLDAGNLFFSFLKDWLRRLFGFATKNPR